MRVSRYVAVGVLLAALAFGSACEIVSPEDLEASERTDATDAADVGDWLDRDLEQDQADDVERDGDAARDVDDADLADSTVRVRFVPGAGFFDAPFPIETRRRADDTIDVSDFPNPEQHVLLRQYLRVVDESPTGFPRNGSIFFAFDGALDPSTLPQSLHDSLRPESSVFFVDIDPLSPHRGERFAVQVRFRAGEESLLLPPNVLTVLPYPGLVQRPLTLYAAVVTRAVRDVDGRPIEAPPLLRQLLAGAASDLEDRVDARLVDGFAALVETLEDAGIDPSDVSAATVYRTGDPTAQTAALQAHADSWPVPDYTIVGRIRDYPTYCVLEGRTSVPIYQVGDRSYTRPGTGHIVFEQGVPVVQWVEDIRFSLSIPKRAMPADGFPLLLYAAGQGGAYTQVVDRGTSAERAADPENGRGPAYYLADVGVASMSLEAATVGPRHPTGSFEGVDFFNVLNLAAFRDNIRQAAAEFTVLANLAETMEVSSDELCTGVDTPAGEARFDPDRFFFYGHSTGASIGHLVLGLDRTFRAGFLSGAGGSWIYNLALKQHPIDMAEMVATLLRLPPDEPLDAFHPVAMLFQMAIEPAEAMNYAPMWLSEPPDDSDPTDVLLIEGVVDGYFLPRMVSALAMAARLDLAGPIHDADLVDDLALVGGSTVDLPAEPNRNGHAGHVVQFAAEGFDGHYVSFELDAPKYLYKCWLDSILVAGTAVVPALVDDGEAECVR